MELLYNKQEGKKIRNVLLFFTANVSWLKN